MNRPFIILLLAMCAICLSSCSSGGGGGGGVTYRQAKAAGALVPRRGRGLAVIYFSGGFLSANTPIYANGQFITDRLDRRGFCTIDPARGPLHLRVNPGTPGTRTNEMGAAIVSGALSAGPVGMLLGAALAPLTYSEDLAVIEVVPGQSYFVEMGDGVWHPKMTVRRPEEAEPAVENRRWINPRNLLPPAPR